MTRDILIHEGEHLQQHILGHPLQKILSLLEKDFDIEALRVLQNVIGETMSYRSQMNYLNLELRRRTSHILTVTVAPDGRSHSVNPTKFGPYLERRKQEVRVGAALSFRMLIPIFKSTDNDTAICGVIRVLTTIARGIRELELALADSTLAEIHGCPKIEKPPRARLSA